MTDLFNRRHVLLGLGAAVAAPSFGLAQDRDVEGGIGGTGIVGVLTEFGSLIVGGNYVETDSSTRFTNGFGRIAERDLQIGDALTVEATGTPLTAKRVHVAHPVVGRIDSFSRGGRVAMINGVAVDMAAGMARRYKVGTRVAVSGLWRGNRVVASGLRVAMDPRDLIAGEVTRGPVRAARLIGGTEVRGTGLSRATLGGYATAIGRYDAAQGRFVSERVTADRFTGAAGPLRRLSVEGYLAPTNTAPNYKVSGLGHSFKRTLKLDPFANKRVLFNGGYAEKFAVEEAVILPEAVAARTRLLGRLSKG